jgi:hypothetical protein
MAKAKVFLSHSSKSKYAQLVRDKVYDGLTAMGLDVLLDKALIEPGDEWRGKLHQWLATCDGAVILFSADAVRRPAHEGSPWVYKEATILSWRHALNPNLLVVPALLGDVKREETRLGDFKSLSIDELQFARADGTEETEAHANQLAASICAEFEKLKTPVVDEAMGFWYRRVAECLKLVGSLHLEEAKRKLKLENELTGIPLNDQQFQMIAYHMLCLGLEAITDSLVHLGEGMRQDKIRTFADAILPIWVSDETARAILQVTRRPVAERFVAINTTFERFANHYVSRATCGYPSVRVARVTAVAGERMTEEILRDVEAALRRVLSVPREANAATLEAALANQKLPVFLILGAGAMHKDVLGEIRKRYGKVTAVLLSGLQFPDPNALGLENLALMEPPLTEEREQQVNVMIGSAKVALDGRQEILPED